MTDGNETFESTKARLEEILAQVRKKDTSLEQSLELLEEGVRLANRCNELIDQTSWRSAEADGDGDELGDLGPAQAADTAEGVPGGPQPIVQPDGSSAPDEADELSAGETADGAPPPDRDDGGPGYPDDERS